MKTKIVFFAAFVFCFIRIAWGQEEKVKFLGFESGIDFFGSNVPEKDYIRGEVASYYSGKETNHLKGFFTKYYLGANAEIRVLNDKFGVLSGLRYNRIESGLGKSTYWSDNPSFFYVLLRQEETTTEYLKVEEIDQSSDYLAVPIELKYFPFGQHRLTIYFKTGVELAWLLKTETEVDFFNEEMRQYNDEVAKLDGDPKSFYSALYVVAGVSLGRFSKTKINIETCLPNLFLSKNVTSLVTPTVGGGFHLNVQFPL